MGAQWTSAGWLRGSGLRRLTRATLTNGGQKTPEATCWTWDWHPPAFLQRLASPSAQALPYEDGCVCTGSLSLCPCKSTPPHPAAPHRCRPAEHEVVSICGRPASRGRSSGMLDLHAMLPPIPKCSREWAPGSSHVWLEPTALLVANDQAPSASQRETFAVRQRWRRWGKRSGRWG